MDPPKGALGQLLTGAAALGIAGWAGAALNSRSVSKANPAAATAAAALGAVTGSLLALFGAATLAVSESKWKTVAQTTTILGIGGFAGAALLGLRANDRWLANAATSPRALTASEADSGGQFALHVGDTLTVELPAGQSGYTWSWAEGPAGVLTGPASEKYGDGFEHDTWTANAVGDVKLTASLAPTGGGASIAAWSASVSVAA